jgi:hypothetical protein
MVCGPSVHFRTLGLMPLERRVVEGHQELPNPQQRSAIKRCPSCAAFLRFATRFLDPRTGKTMRLYECQCGERIWDD